MPNTRDIDLGRVFLSCGAVGALAMATIPAVLGPETRDAPQLLRGYWQEEPFANFWQTESLRFDHPEPNYAVLPGVAEFWSTVTTVPFAGVLLLCTALHQDYQLRLVALYAHVVAMYVGAFLSHMTLLPVLFSLTVCGVVANSLLAYFWWSAALGGVFCSHSRLLSWAGASLGLAVAIAAVWHLQSLPQFAPVAGFVTLAFVQPPFVFLGLCSALLLLHRDSGSPGLRLLCLGGTCLMTAMCVSAVETFVDPLVVAGVPLLHIVIHVLEQIGIYLYGVGAAALEYSTRHPRQRFVLQTGRWLPRLLLLPADHSTGEKTNVGPNADLANIVADAADEGDNNDGVIVDLLAIGPRINPHEFNQQLNGLCGGGSGGKSRGMCPVLHEKHCQAVFDPQLVREILADDASFSSNPFPDNRLIGLSTLPDPEHSVQRKLVARYFGKRHLAKHEGVFQAIAEHWTQAFAQRRGGDLVRDWAYPIAMASAFAALGVRDQRKYLRNRRFIDCAVRHSTDMVRLVAPLGGMGPPQGLSASQARRLWGQLVEAALPTLGLAWRVGWKTAWSLLRPDLNLLGGGDDAKRPRTGVASGAAPLSSVPRYFGLLDRLWEEEASRDGDSAMGALWRAQREGAISRADGLLLIVQSLVSMTTANALVNAVDRVLRHPEAAAALRRDPAAAVPGFLQECLRLDAPLQRLPRRTTAEVTLGDGAKLERDTALMLMLGACNQAEGGDGFRPWAEGRSPMLTFGAGAHRCLGEELVRVEMRLALTAWLALPTGGLRGTPGARISDVDVGNYGFQEYSVEWVMM